MPDEIIASYESGKIQLTDTNIRIKHRFRRIEEIPYHSIEGCTFDSSHYSGRGSEPSYWCTILYVDKSGIARDVKLASSKDKYAHEIYAHVLKTLKSLGLKIKQFPCQQMAEVGDMLSCCCAECDFVEPNVNDCTITYDYPRNLAMDFDLGGYLLKDTNIEIVRVRRWGWSSFIEGSDLRYGQGQYFYYGSDFDTDIKLYFDYIIRADTVPQIYCDGHPVKKFLKGTVDYHWEGTTAAQKLNEDSKLREMLIQAEAPEIKLKKNHILIRAEGAPSVLLFESTARIAEHMLHEAILLQEEETTTVTKSRVNQINQSSRPTCTRCGKPILGLSFRTDDGLLLCARCKTRLT